MGKTDNAHWYGPKARLRLAALGVSLALHGLLLGFIGQWHVNAPPLVPSDPRPPVYLQLEPRPLLQGELARRPTPLVPSSPAAPVATRMATSADKGPNDEEEVGPVAPSPRIIAPLPPGSGPTTPSGSTGSAEMADERWSVRTPDLRGAVARSLRLGAAGCRALDGQLSEGEQQICDDRFNEAAGRARPSGPRTLSGPEARREDQFAREGAVAMARYERRYERRRAPMRSGVGVVGATPDCPGGNLRGTCPGANLRPNFQHPENAPQGGGAGPK